MSALDLSSPPSPLFLSSLMPSFFFIFAPHTTFVFPPSTRLFPTYFSRGKKWERRVKRTIFFANMLLRKRSGTWKASQTVYAIQGYMQKVQIALAFCPTCFNLCDAQLLRERKHEKLFQTHSFYAVLPYIPVQTLSRKKLFSGAIPCFVDVQTRVSPYLWGK